MAVVAKLDAPPVLHRAAFEASLALVESATGVAVNVNAATGYALSPITGGAAVYTATPTVAGGVATVTDSGLTFAPGVYLESWTGVTAASGTLALVTREVYVIDQRADTPLVSLDRIRRKHPPLTVYPTSQTSWWPQLIEAHHAVLWALIGTRGRRIPTLTTAQLATVELPMALATIFRAAATFVGGVAAEQGDRYALEARDAWRALGLEWDTDGDGDSDTGPEPVGAQGAPPGPRARR